ncbi:MAG: hypothetical protein R3C28_00865 [Pirellulaceae bacterium]
MELVVDDWPELGDDRIIGIDVHVLDNVNVDKNSDDPNNDVLPGQYDDDLTFFRIEDGTDRLYADQYIEPNAERFLDLDDPSGYQEWRTDLDDYSYTYIPLTTGSASYSMLAWESRGTVWDFNYFNDLFDHTSINGCNPAQSNQSCAPWINKSQVDVFTDAFIDDLFEKFRLQIIDFDGSGHIDLADDLPAFFDAAVSFIDPNIPNADERVFDLNNNGVFVSDAQTASPQIDAADIERMIVLFGTQFGDSNLDFQYSTSDFIAVFSVGEFEDTNDLNSTWTDGDWSGDFEFDSSDFVVVFTADTFESGYADVDGDGRYDFLPIWVDPNTIDPLTFDGLVSWYQPNWADPTV